MFQKKVLLLLALAAGGVTVWLLTGSAAAEDSETRADKIVDSDNPEWVRDLKAGGKVEFRSRAASDPTARAKTKHPTLKSLGPLSDEQIAKVEGLLDLKASWAEVMSADSKARTEGTESAQLEFLKQNYYHAKREACFAMLRKGDYITLPGHSRFAAVPAGYVRHGYMGCLRIDGKSADVWFLIDTKDHPTVRSAKEGLEHTETYVRQQKVDKFNRMSMAERERASQAHASAILETSAIIADKNLSADARRASIIAARGRMFPVWMRVDKTRYFATLRVLRHQ